MRSMENCILILYTRSELCESCDSCALELLGVLNKRCVASRSSPQWHARGHGFKSLYLHLILPIDSLAKRNLECFQSAVF